MLEFPQSGERFEGVVNIREWRSRDPRYGVDLLEIRNDKIVRETIYVGEPFDPPEWRSQWRTG